MEELNELFYKDPYLKSFAATVTSCSEGKNGFEVVLDDTAFTRKAAASLQTMERSVPLR